MLDKEGSELLSVLFNQLMAKQKISHRHSVIDRISRFMTENGYRFAFGRWYLQEDPGPDALAEKDAVIEGLRGALEFYADLNNYDTSLDNDRGDVEVQIAPVLEDEGERAREILDPPTEEAPDEQAEGA